MRYFLIDRVTELVPGERIRGIKNVTLSDPILHDHFPDHPVMPGALIVEAAAQLAGCLLEATYNRPDSKPRRALMVQIQQAKFHDLATPGDRLEITATLAARQDDAAQVRAEVTADGRRIARAELTFMMREINSERVHEQRRYLYQLWTKDLKSKPAIL